MNKNRPIALIHTPCKLCVFADFTENTQTGCAMGYIDKFRKNNVEILEAYDEEKNFYIINNKKCLGYRDDKWLDKHKTEDLSGVVEKENSIKYISIIPIQQTSLLDKTINYINSILDQEIKPKGILLYKNRLENHIINNKDLLDYMNNIPIGIEWRIKNFIDKDMSDDDRLKATITSCPINRFYLLADIDHPLPKNCISNIQSYINNGNSFGCINIDNNKFFSYISVQYCKNIRHINLLSETSLHTKYETIG